MKIYTDASTLNNGQRGRQKTTVYVSNEQAKLLYKNFIGDYTINEGEILAIVAAIKFVETTDSKHIFSDSQIAVNRVLKGLSDYEAKAMELGVVKQPKLRFFKIIDHAHKLFMENPCVVEWIRREDNIAGMISEFG